MSPTAQKARFRDEVANLIRRFDTPNHGQTFVGAESGPPLEHVTREHFISPFLEALGWDLSQLNDAVIEEARVADESTLRLDYLGVNRQSGTPVVIVEAKPWNAPFVSASKPDASLKSVARNSDVGLICGGIEHGKAGKNPKKSPVSGEWIEYLSKLQQYVANLANVSGHVPTRVATLSGRWLVVFDDPRAVFLTPGTVNPELVSIFRGDEFVSHADRIFDKLAQVSVSVVVPDLIEPTQIHAYVRATAIRQAFRALWVTYEKQGPVYRARPTLEIDAAVVIERKDDVLLTIVDKSLRGHPLPNDRAELGAHIAAVEQLADKLLIRINAELGDTLNFADVSAFAGFARNRPASQVEGIAGTGSLLPSLAKVLPHAQELLLVTGTAKHFLLPVPRVNPCEWHDWSSCSRTSVEQGGGPIVGPSVKPRTYFISAEPQHCAHRVVHHRRSGRCQIDAFEEFLCCRVCVLQTYCWKKEELEALPCGKAAGLGGTGKRKRTVRGKQ